MQIKLKLLYLTKSINHNHRQLEKQIAEKDQGKYLCVTKDNELNYPTEVKIMLSKKAPSVKCLYNLRDCLPKKYFSCYDQIFKK